MKKVVFMPGILTRTVTAKVAPAGIRYKNRYYWNELILKHVGEAVEVKEVNSDTIEVFKDGQFIVRAEEKEMIIMDSSKESIIRFRKMQTLRKCKQPTLLPSV